MKISRAAQVAVPTAVALLFMAAAAAAVSGGGTITTIAGTGKFGRAGDGGPATSAQLSAPDGVAVDRQGKVYITDSNNERVRKVSPGGTITAFAGGGACRGDGGPGTAAKAGRRGGAAVARE